MMGKDEIAAFPLVAEYQPYMYLAIRNLIMALWSQNVKVGWMRKVGLVGGIVGHDVGNCKVRTGKGIMRSRWEKGTEREKAVFLLIH